jgi:hypothetical protein
MFLINAIYFKGNWTYQFDESQTQDEPFYLLDGSTTTCQLMSQKALHRYFFNDDFQAVDLPYGDGAYSMTLFVPGEHTDINALIAQFDPQNLSNWLSQFSSDSVNVFIPRFKLEYDRELKDDLTALGMGIAFTGAADFTNMYANGGVWISKVKHKTFVEVNEEGTEAAAVTDVEMVYEGGYDPLTFRADRPFVFMIRENESGTILFIGKITDFHILHFSLFIFHSAFLFPYYYCPSTSPHIDLLSTVSHDWDIRSSTGTPPIFLDQVAFKEPKRGPLTIRIPNPYSTDPTWRNTPPSPARCTRSREP